jgi:hypothetical protein
MGWPVPGPLGKRDNNMPELKVVSNESSFEHLIDEVFEMVKDQESVQTGFMEQAHRSNRFGYNVIGWAKVAEACAKSYFLFHPLEVLLTDTFILSLAIKLAEYFQVKYQTGKEYGLQ